MPPSPSVKTIHKTITANFRRSQWGKPGACEREGWRHERQDLCEKITCKLRSSGGIGLRPKSEGGDVRTAHPRTKVPSGRREDTGQGLQGICARLGTSGPTFFPRCQRTHMSVIFLTPSFRGEGWPPGVCQARCTDGVDSSFLAPSGFLSKPFFCEDAGEREISWDILSNICKSDGSSACFFSSLHI